MGCLRSRSKTVAKTKAAMSAPTLLQLQDAGAGTCSSAFHWVCPEMGLTCSASRPASSESTALFVRHGGAVVLSGSHRQVDGRGGRQRLDLRAEGPPADHNPEQDKQTMFSRLHSDKGYGQALPGSAYLATRLSGSVGADKTELWSLLL